MLGIGEVSDLHFCTQSYQQDKPTENKSP